MLAPRTGIMSAAVALATLGRAGAVLRGGQNATQERGADPCECQSWYDVYEKNGMCGRSNEYFFASGIHQPAPEHVVGLAGLWSAYCSDFFMRIDDNVCVNINIGTEYGQWCYVDAACEDLNGAQGKGRITANKALRWKQCTSGRDRMLRDYSIKDLVGFTQRHGIPLHLADHLAWPTFYHGQWKQVGEFFTPGSKFAERMEWELREELEAIVAYGKPVVFHQTSTLKPPHMIVEGKTRFNVEGP
mmetsp:Transcript_73935/g.208725  ORF Transcript_73935/g.208725 Transcript_73935/m.208725 type:complete len:245 (-) Transcript_73935:148-882(-)